MSAAREQKSGETFRRVRPSLGFVKNNSVTFVAPVPTFLLSALVLSVLVLSLLRLNISVAMAVRLDPGRTHLLKPKETEMVRIPAGWFLMGSSKEEMKTAQALCVEDLRPTNPGQARVCSTHLFMDEHPRRKVYVSTFYIDRHPVTRGRYLECVAAGACSMPPVTPKQRIFWSDHVPVVGVEWKEAARYCRWRKKRLPTEAEWEKAARGPFGRIWPWGNKWAAKRCNHGNLNPVTTAFEGDASDGHYWISPINGYLGGRSFYGVAGFAGNVSEWVSDRYSARPPKAKKDRIDPKGPKSGSYRVVKGGSWYGPRFLTRAASRLSYPPKNKESFVGFRCARKTNL